jgi:hypothetical protein
VANVVAILKKDGRIMICIYYRVLNKASLKDDFPLPHIQVLVEKATKKYQLFIHEWVYIYNQIKMAKKGKEKTTFVIL